MGILVCSLPRAHHRAPSPPLARPAGRLAHPPHGLYLCAALRAAGWTRRVREKRSSGRTLLAVHLLLPRRRSDCACTMPNLDCRASLPHDVLRAIWQHRWREDAADKLQCAWRVHSLRRAWSRMHKRWAAMRYILEYMLPGQDPHSLAVVEYQSRGAIHMHTPVWPEFAYMEEVD